MNAIRECPRKMCRSKLTRCPRCEQWDEIATCGCKPYLCRDCIEKQNAFQSAVLAVAERARAALPAANGRIERAVELVLDGAVTIHQDGAEVHSQTDDGITYVINGTSCGCKDAQYQAPRVSGRPACKHQVAVWLVKRANEELQAQKPVGGTGPGPAIVQPATPDVRVLKTSGGTVDIEAGKVARAWCARCKRGDDIPRHDWRGVVHTCGNVIAKPEEVMA